ncbi:MAG: serine/threonine-protein kinase [Planctomycetota bacterium]
MPDALENSESGSEHGETLVPDNDSAASDLTKTSSGPLQVEAADLTHVGKTQPRENQTPKENQTTESFQQDFHSEPAQSSQLGGENQLTKISQLPVAAPEEYFRSVPLAELASMLEGKRLDHFAVEQMIGGGGMGAVFRGRDLRLDRIVAVKVIPAAKKDPDTLRRFRQEAQAAARLDHPHIARVYYIGEAEQWNYIVFEFIDGVNIRDLVAMNGPLSIDDAIFYTRQVAEALSHAHEREVVHRDVKPSNLLVTATGVIKVVDMGLARNTSMDQSSNDATASGVTLGTFDYISPEQARNPRDADVRSDLYSLGCSLFFMLTGKPPFSEGTVLQKLLKHGSVPPPDPRGWRDDVSDQVYAIMMKLMAKQPSARYQNPQDLISDLLMLAEVEDLPRSQLPATVMFAPAFTQRSLVETNLPWLVALAFLLGSTLWLQSVQAISNGFELPAVGAKDQRLSLPEPKRDEDLASEPIVPALDNQGAEPPSGERAIDIPGSAEAGDSLGGIYVVSQFRPANVEESRWLSSLSAAVEQLKAIPGVEIEVRGTVTLDSVVDGSNASLKIRGNPDVPSKIVVAPTLIREVANGAGVWNVDNASLELRDLELELDSSRNSVDTSIAFFESNGNSDFRLDNITATLESREATNVSLIQIEENPQQADEESSAFNALAISGFRDVDISFESCLLRGQGVAIGTNLDLTSSIPCTVSFTNCLVALSDWILGANATPAGVRPQVDRNIRIFCDSSTFYSGKGFARLETGDIADPLISINRTSESCVYESPAEASSLVLVGPDSAEAVFLLNRFLFKGSDNAYDEKMERACSCLNLEGEEVFSFTFQAATQNGWFLERGNERRVNWQEIRDPQTRLSELSWEDFGIAKDRFSPGFSRE